MISGLIATDGYLSTASKKQCFGNSETPPLPGEVGSSFGFYFVSLLNALDPKMIPKTNVHKRQNWTVVWTICY